MNLRCFSILVATCCLLLVAGCSSDPADPCPNSDPDACSGETPAFDTASCSCVECTDHDYCEDDELMCGDDNTCVEHGCDDVAPDDCSGETPIFADDACECVECLDDFDCLGGDCEDRVCIEDDDEDDGCESDEDCDGEATCEEGDCVFDNGDCQLDPTECTEPESILDTEACECVECAIDQDCDDGYACTDGSCEVDEPAPDACYECELNDQGFCGDETDAPYCDDGCCVECIGFWDCESGEHCSPDGFCESHADDCDSDDDCPDHLECQSGGDISACIPPSDTESCSGGCSPGHFCDVRTGLCEGLGGDEGCGFCHDDCTCPDGLECIDGHCVGCETPEDEDDIDEACHDDLFCFPPDDVDEYDDNFCAPL